LVIRASALAKITGCRSTPTHKNPAVSTTCCSAFPRTFVRRPRPTDTRTYIPSEWISDFPPGPRENRVTRTRSFSSITPAALSRLPVALGSFVGATSSIPIIRMDASSLPRSSADQRRSARLWLLLFIPVRQCGMCADHGARVSLKRTAVFT